MFTNLQSILPKFSIEIDFSLMRIYKVKSKFQKISATRRIGPRANWLLDELIWHNRKLVFSLFLVTDQCGTKVSVTVADFGGEMWVKNVSCVLFLAQSYTWICKRSNSRRSHSLVTKQKSALSFTSQSSPEKKLKCKNAYVDRNRNSNINFLFIKNL